VCVYRVVVVVVRRGRGRAWAVVAVVVGVCVRRGGGAHVLKVDRCLSGTPCVFRTHILKVCRCGRNC